ncbi:MAG: SMP-30/gluconolactonase/LRE family protein [Friedmanniella sp.]|jgi:sugar lactone lactonase YvrE|nr:SMP-30/gluconolactonase/LRE family protein [Friedmanniella sp.]
MDAEQLTPPLAEHAEGPVYSPRWPGVRWVDMTAGDLLELQPDGSVRRHHVGPVAAMLRPRTGGGHVVCGERGLVLADIDELTAPVRARPEVWSDPGVRMNEGGCDPSGVLYAGSMAYDQHPGGARLYRFDPTGGVSVVLDSVTISNGIDWSPEGTLAYYNDTPTGEVSVFDWSSDTGLTNRRRFVTVEGEGHPDGLTVDAEGGVWVALFGGSAVRRYAPDGTLDAVVSVGTSQVTAMTFGGPGLDQLYITTSKENMGSHPEPRAGALFRAVPGVLGQPVRPFAG